MSNWITTLRAAPLALVLAVLVPCSAAPAAGGLKAQYRTSFPASGNQLGPVISLVNGGSSTVPLASVTVRYWFTVDGTAAPRFFCDYTQRGCANVTSRFASVTPTTSSADTYLELGFTAGAGTLAAGQSTGEIQGRVAKSDWSAFNQSNDWSYDATKTTSADWSHVTVYLNGARVWGTEPGGGVPPTCTATPPAPTGLTATATSSSQISLTWNAVAAPASCTVTYQVYRGTTSGFTPAASNQVAAGLTAASFASAGLTAGTTYFYVVRAVDAAGSSASSAQASATTTAGGVPGPADWTVYAFSQSDPEVEDPQVTALQPDVNIRAFQKWSTNGLAASDYDFAQVAHYHQGGISFIGGGTASVIFRPEFASDAVFDDMSTRDANGVPVPQDNITTGARRGSIMNPAFRDALVAWCKLQIDGGVDGIFLDEVNGGFGGGQVHAYNGNEGFDDYALADFNRYLLAKYPTFTAADWKSRFGMTDANLLRTSVPPQDLVNNFNYRTYLQSHGWNGSDSAGSPLNPANPLAAEWGKVVGNRMYADDATFTGTYVRKYWKEIVDRLRAYAASTSRRILITSNGLLPYVDFNSVGLYPWNPDEQTADYRGADYVPVVGGHLDGAKSLQANYRYLKDKSAQISGDVPVVIFIDWPTDMMTSYLALPLPEKQDFWRIFGAEAYANGIYPALHLKDTVGDPTADQQGMLSFFRTYAQFYEDHRALYRASTASSAAVTVGASNVSASLMVQRSNGAQALHLVNHNYNQAIVPQGAFTVTAGLASCPARVTIVSPDFAGAKVPASSCSQGRLTVTVDSLQYYDVLVLE